MRVTSELTVVPLATCELWLKHTCIDERRRHALDVGYGKLGPRTPMSTGEQVELLCEHAGLAQAYQWVHLSELI